MYRYRTNLSCPKCGRPLETSDYESFPYFCFHCDENFNNYELEKKDAEIYVDMSDEDYAEVKERIPFDSEYNHEHHFATIKRNAFSAKDICILNKALKGHHDFDLKQIISTDEYIGEFFTNYEKGNFICPQDADERSDLAGFFEETLHRMLHNGATKDDIRRILIASEQTDFDDENNIYIDLGYCIEGPVYSVSYGD